MKRILRSFAVLAALAVTPQYLSAQASQPVVFSALVGPGPETQTNENTGSFTFSTPDGSVDLDRQGGPVSANPGTPPAFFIAPPGTIQSIDPVGTGIDSTLDGAAGFLD
ncbi:hypothetical protein [Pseudooceanicola sp. MF1-13]|uniref:hypothetical protein n=1 Tax=Pseudooceanicola sp. MF1-13 TaxID=3379095 RepID=UPI0038929373